MYNYDEYRCQGIVSQRKTENRFGKRFARRNNYIFVFKITEYKTYQSDKPPCIGMKYILGGKK